LFSFGVPALDALLVPPDCALDDVPEEPDGGMLADEDDDGDVVLGVDDVDDDVELDGGVAGVVVVDDDDVDGEGVTTGGVVEVVVELSRLQPASPSTTPVQSTVINALFIAISNSR
jgi:hypothetical protein